MMSFAIDRSINEHGVDEAIVLIIGGLAKKFGKNYCFPSQEKLLYLLNRFYGVSICRRTLNYHLSRLTTGGYIHRKRRITKGRDGVLLFKSTLYFLCKQAMRWIARLRRLSACLSSRFTPTQGVVPIEKGVSRERAKEFIREINFRLNKPVLPASQ